MGSSYLNTSLVCQSMFSGLFLLKNHMSFSVIHRLWYLHTIHTEFKFTNQIQIQTSSHLLNRFNLHYLSKYVYLMAKLKFQQSLLQVFCVTWSLRNQMWCQRNISYYYHRHCWKQLCGYFFYGNYDLRQARSLYEPEVQRTAFKMENVFMDTLIKCILAE